MDNIKEILTDEIKLPQDNMRQHIDRDAIFELAEDIKKNGLISPITVRPKDGVFELVAGQRRYLAHQYAGILKIKCIVKILSDAQAFAIMTSENLARVDVNPIDEAKHICRLMEYNENDIKKVSHIVARGEQWIKDRLSVAQMPDYIQEFIGKKEIKLGVALILAQIDNENYRRNYIFQAVRDGVSVAMAESWLAYYKSLLLPGGVLSIENESDVVLAPPQAVMFRDAIDGMEYDCRLCKSVIIYEGNLQYFNAFVDAFRNPPPETEL